MKVKDSSKCKEWERRRRDRLSDGFKNLAELLPNHDPAKIPAKIDILENSTQFIKELRLSNSRLLSTNTQPKEMTAKIKHLQDEVNKLIIRVKQLTALLVQAKIPIPIGPSIKLLGTRRLKWSNKLARANCENGYNSKTPTTTTAVPLSVHSEQSLNSTQEVTVVAEKNGKTKITVVSLQLQDDLNTKNSTIEDSRIAHIDLDISPPSTNSKEKSKLSKSIKTAKLNLSDTSSSVRVKNTVYQNGNKSVNPDFVKILGNTVFTVPSGIGTSRHSTSSTDPKFLLLSESNHKEKLNTCDNSKINYGCVAPLPLTLQPTIFLTSLQSTPQQFVATFLPSSSSAVEIQQALIPKVSIGSTGLQKIAIQRIRKAIQKRKKKPRTIHPKIKRKSKSKTESSTQTSSEHTSTSGLATDVEGSGRNPKVTRETMSSNNEPTESEMENTVSDLCPELIDITDTEPPDKSDIDQASQVPVSQANLTSDLTVVANESMEITQELQLVNNVSQQEVHWKQVAMEPVELDTVNVARKHVEPFENSAALENEAKVCLPVVDPLNTETEKLKNFCSNLPTGEKVAETEIGIQQQDGEEVHVRPKQPETLQNVQQGTTVLKSSEESTPSQTVLPETTNPHSPEIQTVATTSTPSVNFDQVRENAMKNSLPGEDATSTLTTDKISECIARSLGLIEHSEETEAELMELGADWSDVVGVGEISQSHSPKSPISPTQMFLSMFPLLPRESITLGTETHVQATSNSTLLPHGNKSLTGSGTQGNSRSSFYIDSMLPEEVHPSVSGPTHPAHFESIITFGNNLGITPLTPVTSLCPPTPTVSEPLRIDLKSRNSSDSLDTILAPLQNLRDKGTKEILSLTSFLCLNEPPTENLPRKVVKEIVTIEKGQTTNGWKNSTLLPKKPILTPLEPVSQQTQNLDSFFPYNPHHAQAEDMERQSRGHYDPFHIPNSQFLPRFSQSNLLPPVPFTQSHTQNSACIAPPTSTTTNPSGPCKTLSNPNSSYGNYSFGQDYYSGVAQVQLNSNTTAVTDHQLPSQTPLTSAQKKESGRKHTIPTVGTEKHTQVNQRQTHQKIKSSDLNKFTNYSHNVTQEVPLTGNNNQRGQGNRPQQEQSSQLHSKQNDPKSNYQQTNQNLSSGLIAQTQNHVTNYAEQRPSHKTTPVTTSAGSLSHQRIQQYEMPGFSGPVNQNPSQNGQFHTEFPYNSTNIYGNERGNYHPSEPVYHHGTNDGNKSAPFYLPPHPSAELPQVNNSTRLSRSATAQNVDRLTNSHFPHVQSNKINYTTNSSTNKDISTAQPQILSHYNQNNNNQQQIQKTDHTFSQPQPSPHFPIHSHLTSVQRYQAHQSMTSAERGTALPLTSPSQGHKTASSQPQNFTAQVQNRPTTPSAVVQSQRQRPVNWMTDPPYKKVSGNNTNPFSVSKLVGGPVHGGSGNTSYCAEAIIRQNGNSWNDFQFGSLQQPISQPVVSNNVNSRQYNAHAPLQDQTRNDYGNFLPQQQPYDHMTQQQYGRNVNQFEQVSTYHQTHYHQSNSTGSSSSISNFNLSSIFPEINDKSHGNSGGNTSSNCNYYSNRNK